jgi:CDP-diacylglycerol--serine O-phosphatidyltransferase
LLAGTDFMADGTPSRKLRLKLPIVQLIPNLVTVGALCAGLTAIRFATEGRFGLAIAMIVIAAVLDGLDGRLARLLKSETEMGAELDSLCDIVNFGVAPGLVVYLWALNDTRNEGWIAALIYVVACLLRLARFNIGNRAPESDGTTFQGVPSPAGAMLVLLPLILSYTFDWNDGIPDAIVAVWMIAVGAMLVGRFRTPSFKKATIYADQARYIVLSFVVLVAALLTYPWATLAVFDVAYLMVVISSLIQHWRKPKTDA